MQDYNIIYNALLMESVMQLSAQGVGLGGARHSQNFVGVVNIELGAYCHPLPMYSYNNAGKAYADIWQLNGYPKVLEACAYYLAIVPELVFRDTQQKIHV